MKTYPLTENLRITTGIKQRNCASKTNFNIRRKPGRTGNVLEETIEKKEYKEEWRMIEIWKDIDDRYSVSNLGRVKSNYANKERILRPYKNADGYFMVDLRHGGKRRSVRVHRLVAEAFIDNPNPELFNEVNHKDEDKTNNRMDNLEWCDTKYNCNYGTRNIRKAENCQKPVCSVDKYGNVVHYKSRKEAAETLGISPENISKVLSPKFKNNKTAGGLLWFYDDGAVDERRQISTL